jgi:hypothetical protein
MLIKLVSVMSCTFTLSHHSSILSANFFPAIELDKHSQYGIGLLGFYSYNSIFNVDESNNMIGLRVVNGSKAPYFEGNHGVYESVNEINMQDGSSSSKVFVLRLTNESDITYFGINHGAYEIDEINKEIQKNIRVLTHTDTINDHSNNEGGHFKERDDDHLFSLHPNNNTLKCELKSVYELDFTLNKSLASLLGYDRKSLAANVMHVSTKPVNIMKVRMIRVECNITSGAYINTQESHTLFEFDIDVTPGYKLTKEPQHIIYLPVKPEGRQFIDNITLRIVDDNGELVNFQGEKIIVKLELKKLS